MEEVVHPPKRQSSRTHLGVQGHGVSVTFASSSNEVGHKEADTAGDVDGRSPTVIHRIDSLLRQERGDHTHRQVARPHHPAGAEYKLDMFGPGS